MPAHPIAGKEVAGIAHADASLYTGRWTDVGTPERLAQLNASTETTPSMQTLQTTPTSGAATP